MPAEVEYLQVAFSFVVKDKVAWVVPEGNVPEGVPEKRIGGLVAGRAFVVAETIDD